MDVSHRQEVSTSSSYCRCCEPEFDPAQLERPHDALDSPSMLCIRVPSPLAWGRNNVRDLRAQRRHVLRDGGRGSILTTLPFSMYSTIGVPAVDYSGSSMYELLLYKYLIPGTVRGTCRLRTIRKKMKCLFLPRAAHKIVHYYYITSIRNKK